MTTKSFDVTFFQNIFFFYPANDEQKRWTTMKKDVDDLIFRRFRDDFVGFYPRVVEESFLFFRLALECCVDGLE